MPKTENQKNGSDSKKAENGSFIAKNQGLVGLILLSIGIAMFFIPTNQQVHMNTPKKEKNVTLTDVIKKATTVNTKVVEEYKK